MQPREAMSEARTSTASIGMSGISFPDDRDPDNARPLHGSSFGMPKRQVPEPDRVPRHKRWRSSRRSVFSGAGRASQRQFEMDSSIAIRDNFTI